MTKREMYAAIKAIPAVSANEEMVAFIDHEVELLEKKAATPRKPTKVQIENAEAQAQVIDYLAAVDKPLTIREIQGGVAMCANYSTSKMSHILNSAVYDVEKNPEGVLEKVYIKKVPYFSVRTEEVEDEG